MSEAPHGLAIWCIPEGCWAILLLSCDVAKLEGLRDRLVHFTEADCIIFPVASFSDDDVEAAGSQLLPPQSALFVRPDACN